MFERLAHHLVPGRFPTTFVDRFLLLVLLVAILDHVTPRDQLHRRLRMFVIGSLVIAGVGVAIGLVEHFSTALAASLLRFYWFRLSDVAVPLAVALVGSRYLLHELREHPRWGKKALAVALLIAVFHVGGYALHRTVPTLPRADRVYDNADRASQMRAYYAWRAACSWVAESGEVPADARFLTPRMAQTFKWYAGRSEVVTWKDVPQDARSIVEWWDELHDIYAVGDPQRGYRWHNSLAELGPERLKQLGAKYGADYALTVRWPPVGLPVVYENELYVIYRMDDR